MSNLYSFALEFLTGFQQHTGYQFIGFFQGIAGQVHIVRAPNHVAIFQDR